MGQNCLKKVRNGMKQMTGYTASLLSHGKPRFTTKLNLFFNPHPTTHHLSPPFAHLLGTVLSSPQGKNIKDIVISLYHISILKQTKTSIIT